MVTFAETCKDAGLNAAQCWWLLRLCMMIRGKTTIDFEDYERAYATMMEILNLPPHRDIMLPIPPSAIPTHHWVSVS